ncbi:uncharacterized protein [Ambystoma mexicanum]|uniref:uncharacterized protein n=1 Tax=Ambystoma mexicanum TaxID=8296 RepID=UPI0037E99635
MASRKQPVAKEVSDQFVCKICCVPASSEVSLNQHYCGSKHKRMSEFMCLNLFDYIPEKTLTCLEDVFNDPNRKGTIVGLQYLKLNTSNASNPYFKCSLCSLPTYGRSIFSHVNGQHHKEEYIKKTIPFLYRQIRSWSSECVDKIAKEIEAVEGITKLITDMPIQQPLQGKNPTDGSSRQSVLLDCILKTLSEIGVHFVSSNKKIQNLPSLKADCPVHESVNKKRWTPPSLKTDCPISEIPSKRLKRFSTSSAKPIPQWPSQSYGTPQPVMSGLIPRLLLSNSSPLHFPFGQIRENNPSLPLNARAAWSPPGVNLPQAVGQYGSENGGNSQAYSPAVCGFPPPSLLPIYRYFPPHVPSASSNRPVVCDYTQRPQDVSTKRIPSLLNLDISHSHIGRNLEPEPKHLEGLQSLGTIPNLNPLPTSSSLRGPTNDFSRPRSPARVGGSLGNSEIWPSELPASSATDCSLSTVVHVPPASGDTPSSQLIPLSSFISSEMQSSKDPDSSTTEQNCGLSPDILKILKGKDVETVTSILTRVAKYYPPLQEVDISKVVDILFGVGALG